MPLSVYVTPFQSKLSQAVTSSEDDELLLIVKFKVAVESQPDISSCKSIGLSVYVTPFQSKLSQAVTSSEDDELLLIVKFKVAVESQPVALVVAKV